MSYDVLKNDIKNLVLKMEFLSKEIQDKISNDQDILALGTELVRNSTTFVFTLGELSHAKEVQGTVVAQSSKPKSNKIFKRDSLGRFTR